jgi:hypothetical protein
VDKTKLIAILAALGLTACDVETRKHSDSDGGNASEGNVSAEGRAEENMVTIEAPGVDIKVKIPEGVRNRAEVDSDSDLLYPGSTMGGVHIQAGNDDKGAVEIRFSNPASPEKVAAWYRETARTGFKIDSETREGDGTVFNGHETDDNSRFKLRLSPKAGGGTDGVLSVQE